jgi:hypothetical protein
MRASKFSSLKKAFVIDHGEKCMPVAVICRKVGISRILPVGSFDVFC